MPVSRHGFKTSNIFMLTQEACSARSDYSYTGFWPALICLYFLGLEDSGSSALSECCYDDLQNIFVWYFYTLCWHWAWYQSSTDVSWEG